MLMACACMAATASSRAGDAAVYFRQDPVTGRVTDSTGASVAGVTVFVKSDKSLGTTTDAGGRYSLDVSPGAVLVFSALGYEPVERTVAGARLDVTLRTSVSALNQLVVVGYGTEKKVDLTGSVATIAGDEIARRQVGQTSMALQGLVPGVTVTQPNGQPGIDGGVIRIRGIGTLNDADPLVLVDGVEMSMNTIDPSAIASISVLKDAAAAAIYGSKAANGVILITTKRGAAGKLSVSYSGYVGFQTPTNLPKMVNGLDHITMLNEAYTNAGSSPLYSDDYIQQYKAHTGTDQYPNQDWQKAVLNGSGVQTGHTVNLSGGSDRFRLFTSLGYLHQEGILKPISYERYSVRINSDLELSKKLSASLDLYIYNQTRNDVSQFPGANGAAISATGSGLIFGLMNKLPAVQAARYTNGDYGPGQNGVNPVAILDEGGFYQQTSTPVQGNFSLQYKPWEFLSARVSYSPSFSSPQSKSFVNAIQTYYDDGSRAFLVPAKNYLTQTADKDRSDQFNGTVTFSRQYGPHAVAAMGGFQYENVSSGWFNATRDGFLFPQYTVMSAGSSDNMQNDGSATASSLLSYFGRLNYNYKEKYLFEANLRYDGSSRFYSGHKWGLFPSFSAGWRLSAEDFMASLASKVENLKLRASWGRLGNQNIGSDYPFSSTVSLGVNYISDGSVQNGAALTALANQNISWESAEMTDVGLDFTLWKHLSGSFDYYVKKTNGILLRLNIPQTMGLTAPYQNAGVVQNKGWDLQLDYRNVLGKLRYGLTVSLSDVHNKVVDLHGIENNGTVVNHEGYPMNSLYLYHATGLISQDQMENGKYSGATQFGNVQPGDIAYEDYDGNGVINNSDKRILGSTIPRYTYSANLTLGYGNFDLGLLVQGVGKVDGYLSGSAIIPFAAGGTAYQYQKNRWTTEDPNPDAVFPRLAFGQTNNSQPSDFWLRSAAYLRVKNLQVGYSLPKTLTGKANIQNVRIYISADNLFTADDFWPGWDPEISANSNGAYYPQVKTYNVGLNLNF
jgi:TonB-linked SusC/RagA family outer membrane protein